MSQVKIRPGNWEYQVMTPKRDGKPRRLIKQRGFRTKADARAAEAEVRREISRGGYVVARNVTVGMFLTETWLPARRASLKPSTFASYNSAIEVYVLPALGEVKLTDLDGNMLTRFYAELLQDGRRQRNGGLAPKTVRNIAGMLHKALSDAVRWKAITHNPAPDAELPRAEVPEMCTWSAEELGTFLRFVSDDRFAALWRLFATTGMRRAEAVGLRWADVDLDSARLSVISTRTVVDAKVVEGSPKTRAGGRTIALDDATVAALRSWRAVQAQERLLVGSGWRDTGLIFTRPDGTGVRPQWVSREFGRLSRLAGLRPIRLHDLRHSYVSVALSVARVPVKVLSQRVGHSKVSTTLSLYAHVLPGDDEAAAEAVARAFEQS